TLQVRHGRTDAADEVLEVRVDRLPQGEDLDRHAGGLVREDLVHDERLRVPRVPLHDVADFRTVCGAHARTLAAGRAGASASRRSSAAARAAPSQGRATGPGVLPGAGNVASIDSRRVEGSR